LRPNGDFARGIVNGVDGILNQVDQHLLELLCVRFDLIQGLAQLQFQLHLRWDLVLDEPDGPGDHLVDVRRPEILL